MTGVTSSNPDASAYAPQASNKQKDPFAHLTGMERRITVFISNAAAGDEGVHLTDLTKGLGRNVDAEEVRFVWGYTSQLVDPEKKKFSSQQCTRGAGRPGRTVQHYGRVVVRSQRVTRKRACN